MTTPEKPMKPAAPVIGPASPGGECRATSASCTPFQPIAVAPKSAAISSSGTTGQSPGYSAVAIAEIPAITPIRPSTISGGSA